MRAWLHIHLGSNPVWFQWSKWLWRPVPCFHWSSSSVPVRGHRAGGCYKSDRCIESSTVFQQRRSNCNSGDRCTDRGRQACSSRGDYKAGMKSTGRASVASRSGIAGQGHKQLRGRSEGHCQNCVRNPEVAQQDGGAIAKPCRVKLDLFLATCFWTCFPAIPSPAVRYYLRTADRKSVV